jgi:hypothetical protein
MLTVQLFVLHLQRILHSAYWGSCLHVMLWPLPVLTTLVFHSLLFSGKAAAAAAAAANGDASREAEKVSGVVYTVVHHAHAHHRTAHNSAAASMQCCLYRTPFIFASSEFTHVSMHSSCVPLSVELIC